MGRLRFTGRRMLRLCDASVEEWGGPTPALTRASGGRQAAGGVGWSGWLGDMGASPNCYAVAYGAGTGRSNSGLKNRLPRAAKMIGVKPITTA